MSNYELELKRTEFLLPSGKVLLGPKQALGSLYKEFLVQDKVFRFYLYKSASKSFIYKYISTRKKELHDNRLPTLLSLVEN